MKKNNAMTSQEKGAKFEKNANDFFVWLFEEIGFIIAKDRIQFSGTQDGFDIHLIVTINNFERQIHIECKDYKTDLDIGNIFKKALDLEKNYNLTENDLFIAISPRANFKNADNSEKTSPILNEKFPFKSYLLDKSNGIKELFALNDEYYKEIYGLKVDFKIDNLKELERFRSIIYSRKPFKKIFLNEGDRSKFIGNITPNINYFERFLNDSFTNKDDDYTFFYKLNANLKALNEIMEIEDKVLLLGNPGLGKSTELKEFAISKWKIGEVNTFIPIFRNLKNFTVNNKIEDFLPNNFNEFNNCYIIFDGIDEIKDSQDFISKLEVFTETLNNEERVIKFILSCRTNIYESIVKKINDFKVFYLNILSNDEAFTLLKKQLNDESIIERISFKKIHYDFLKNPFLIEILSDYINRTNSLPNNSSELWENYINKRLEFDNKNKLLKLNLNTPLIIKFSKKISLISELMKTNSIKENEIFELIPKQNQEFLKNPLIEKDLHSNSWSFEHRNIQEFFAAKFLSELPYQNIIDFISISENGKRDWGIVRFIKWVFGYSKISFNKTHPSLFNTITFLINILDNPKSEKITKWLEKNEPEILFTADSDRIDEKIRTNVFQNYFNKTCIENKFWISHNGVFGTDAIARFGDNEENFNYLISIFENTKNHFRIIISALDLLAHMSMPNSQSIKIQNLYLLKLKSNNIDSTNSKENDLKIKTHILTCIQKFNFHKENTTYLTEILEFFKDEDDKDFNNSLLYLIHSLDDDVDVYFEFILNEFLRIFDIKKRNKNTKYVSNKIVIEDIILRINNPDNLIEILQYLLNDDNNYHMNFDDNFVLQIFEKCSSIASSDNSFIDNILDLIHRKKHWDLRETELVRLLSSTNSNNKAVEKFIKSEPLNENKYLIARLLSDENIQLIIDKFLKDKTNINDVEVFRNIIGNTNSRDLAISFERTMVEKGYVFKEKYLSTNDIEKLIIDKKLKKQENFDILFDKEKLEFELKYIFEEIEKGNVDWELICDYQSAWYDKHSHSSDIDSSIILLSHLIRDNGALSYPQVVDLINQEHILMAEISRVLNKNNEFIINLAQQQKIYDWCLRAIEEIDYEKIILVREDDHYSVFLDYYICKSIYKFQAIFNFELPQEFYAKTLKYCDLESFNNEDNQFNFIMKKINNDVLFNDLVIDHIIKGDLHSTSLRSHICYSIENNLTNSFDKIKEYLYNDKYLCYQNNNLEKIFEKTKDLDFLKKCCDNFKSVLCWEAIKILLKNNLEKEFIIDKANKYLIVGEENYRLEALGVLFKYNLPEAIEMFFDFVKKGLGESIKVEYYVGYNNENGIKLIERFYYLLYEQGESEDVFKYHYSKELFRHYLNNLSGKNDSLFNQVQIILKKIKKTLKRENKELFYINMLLENSINSFINYKSKPLEFDEAKNKVANF